MVEYLVESLTWSIGWLIGGAVSAQIVIDSIGRHHQHGRHRRDHS